ncbi:c-type cytochrome biogenesis protein CcmI [Abyssibius alkaniclasticus]|uniref:c-type cytochrome biogenesis protein CcmI n=1 Tax=Abyssibius alkaniclasticus TaxID=2881234 RepID=UPI00405A191F
MDIFWILLALITLVLAVAILAPLLAGKGETAPRAAYDMQVYRDQLAEIDRELARGVLDPADAATSRAEIGRRLLAADAEFTASQAATSAPRKLNMIAVAVLSLASVAGIFYTYGRIGAPGYPDFPLAERRAALAESRPSQDVAEEAVARNGLDDPAQFSPDPRLPELVAQLEAATADRPEDLQGQVLLAQFLPQLGRFADARRAQQRVIALKGTAVTASDYIELAELMISATQGYVSPEAEAALRQGLSLDGSDMRGRYYAGLTMAQTGRPDLALQIWTVLLQDSPPDAPYVAAIQAQIDNLRGAAGTAPGQADISDLTAEEQAQVRSMVEGLAARLASDGGSADEWARLVRALVVLGEYDRARAIAAEAEVNFADNPEALALIRAEAANLP